MIVCEIASDKTLAMTCVSVCHCKERSDVAISGDGIASDKTLAMTTV